MGGSLEQRQSNLPVAINVSFVMEVPGDLISVDQRESGLTRDESIKALSNFFEMRLNAIWFVDSVQALHIDWSEVK